ncbi:MAG: hypothetical protein WCK59_01185 [Candidatus Falkowbacteria bacterium]
MESNYLVLPIGKIKTKSLEPWFKWLGRQGYDAFTSFQEIVEYFEQLTKPLGRSEIVCYSESSYIESPDFLKEEVLFCVNFNICKLDDMNAHLFVKFFINGTVEIMEIYLDDSVLLGQVQNNIKKLDHVIEQHQETSKLSWKEFVKLHGEIMSGVYNVELEMPSF